MKTVKDDRIESTTSRERASAKYLIGGRDTFLSGWGEAEGGYSDAFWACTKEQRESVTEWVQSRSDIRDVKEIVLQDAVARGGTLPRVLFPQAAHVHIYFVRPDHPALK
tara:strand:+ start:380 stop:706 length:327 start_codon:yes stop_codon:yes gene_type:complete